MQCQKDLLRLKITVPPNVNHSIIYNLSLRNIHSRFQQSQNQLRKQQNNETQKHDKLCKNHRTQQHEQQQNQSSKLFIGNLNVNVTSDDIYEIFGLKATLGAETFARSKNREIFDKNLRE